MSGLSNGFAQLFKQWGKGIGNAADNVWLRADAQKAIRDEVEKKFKPKIDIASNAESKRAKNIKDLDKKLAESKDNWQKARDDWQAKYDNALAGAKSQRQTEIADYKTQLKSYQKDLDDANASRQIILDQLKASEANYNKYKTIYTDVNTGNDYILNMRTGAYEPISAHLPKKPKKQQKFIETIQDYDHRLFDPQAKNKVINAFDESDINTYQGKSNIFNNYYLNKISPQNTALRNADNQITQADDVLRNWKKSKPAAWDEVSFKQTYEKTNGKKPTDYSFNDQNYQSKSDLDTAYQEALASEQRMKSLFSGRASRYASQRDAEIAQRIQDAKDINKAKVALGGTLGAGALYAGARAMYGGNDTDNTDNIDTTDNTYTGEPDPDFNVKNIPEGQAQLNDEQSDTAPINTGFDPDKADALAAAAYDKGVEDGNSIESSTSDLGNNIAASTGGHTIDDRLFELIKAMQDPYKADAVANYIYSRRGNDPELQRLGWRAWLNKYYGDSLRSMMNIDPSGYNGMHVSGGL